MSQVGHRTQELWDTAVGTWQGETEVEILKMLERKQRRTYLAFQTTPQRWRRKLEPADIAGLLAANDAYPQAAILPPVPRGEEVFGVVDATLEIQQRVPLPGHASCGNAIGSSRSGRMPCARAEQSSRCH
ncbi:hypothetical protein E2562_002019 [Oryza meyeriana var. granulata]|uniref:Uncharacterized protein n=1 Tax=Oryza meyeriana var. granulata TaxID=110450 RepID=A0A6G1C3X8_9ORYZ|nr:hypothetical protein E2562_002019 [Oryza meyeriana var. granulata]